MQNALTKANEMVDSVVQRIAYRSGKLVFVGSIESSNTVFFVDVIIIIIITIFTYVFIRFAAIFDYIGRRQWQGVSCCCFKPKNQTL